MSKSSFDRHVRAHVRLVRVGGLKLVPMSNLRAFVERGARHTLDAEGEP